MITENFGGKEKLIAYEWFLPQIDTEFFYALTFIILGVIVISLVELIAEKIK
jgi:putative membrane protein